MLHGQEYGVSFSAHEQYMRQVKRTPQLTSEEEASLLLSIQSGNNACQARDRLIEGYQPLLIGLAKRFARRCKEMELLDLVQEGNLGLLQAIEKYDVSKESCFRTFAFSWVRGTMLTGFWRYEGAIRLPLSKVRAIRQMGIANTHLLSLFGREPTIAETAREMQVYEREVRELVVLQEQQIVSLHAFPTDDEDLSLEDVVADPTPSYFVDDGPPVPTPLETALASLTERERIVVNLRYGFDDGQARTQREVAHLLGVALSTVEVVDRRAQMRLRKALTA